MKRRGWTVIEDECMRRFYPHLTGADMADVLKRTRSSVFQRARLLGLEKSPEFLASDRSGRVHRGKSDPRMAGTQFKPGLEPWNKGKKGVNGNSASRFKPGQMPQTWKPVGSIRMERDGPKVKVSDTREKAKDWRYVHHLVWEAANGPAPAGMVIAFKPGMKTNDPEEITADRLECIDRAELARRNHPRARSPEIGRLIQLKGAITRQVNRITREAQA